MLDPRTFFKMALPLVKTVPECADYFQTVQPFLPQYYDLPYQVAAHITDLQGLKDLYVNTNPLMTALAFATMFVTPLVLAVSEINGNYSQVDRLWSLLPTIYNIHYSVWAHANGLPTLRVDHVMAVSALWSMRLTFNYWRKGGYSIGSEDYRWNIVKDYVGPVGMFIFDVVFIAFAQNILLLAVTTPTYILLLNSRFTGNELSTYDTIFGRTILFLVVVEFFADQQQWNFHKAKGAYLKTAKVPSDHKYTRDQLDRGFNTSGLWAWSRHPNFAAEQAVWACLYQWGCMQSQTYINWSFAGAMSYLILFQASTWLTELLSAGKYPEYKVYQQRVGKFFPKGNTKSMDLPFNEKEKKKVEEAKAGKGAKKL